MLSGTMALNRVAAGPQTTSAPFIQLDIDVVQTNIEKALENQPESSYRLILPMSVTQCAI